MLQAADNDVAHIIRCLIETGREKVALADVLEIESALRMTSKERAMPAVIMKRKLETKCLERTGAVPIMSDRFKAVASIFDQF